MLSKIVNTDHKDLDELNHIHLINRLYNIKLHNIKFRLLLTIIV